MGRTDLQHGDLDPETLASHERTADELLRVRIISGDEVDAIIRTSGERKL
jgi:undecaprenyl pyrophosphate synthase